MDQLVTLPLLDITINGDALSNRAGRLLSEVRVQQRLSLPTVCELAFIDPQGLLAQDAEIAPGDEFAIRLGSKTAELFHGQVTALEYEYGPENQRMVRVRGYDKLHQLRKRQPVRAHVEATLRDLAQTLLADSGVSLALDEPGPVWRKLVQYRQSDLELLTEIAESCGQYFFLRDDVLHFCSLAGSGSAQSLTQGGNLLECRVTANGEPACRSVRISGWDPWRAEQHSGNASSARTGRQVAAAMPPDLFAATGERYIVDKAVQDDQQAEILAQAELDRRIAGEVVFSGVAMGDPQLHPGTPIEVKGVHDSISGQYVLTAVTHLIDHARGYVALLDTAPPARTHSAQQPASTTLGIVTRVDDPDKLGRMRVMLPNFNNIETDWLHSAVPGAGKNKGMIVLNSIDDRVLVHFINNDPAQAVILGGLYGSVEPPDACVVDGEIKRFMLQLPGGQQLVLDDDKNSVTLANGKGTTLRLSPGRVKITNSDESYLEMSRDKFAIHSKVPLEIEAPGQAVTIRGQSIDFVRG